MKVSQLLPFFIVFCSIIGAVASSHAGGDVVSRGKFVEQMETIIHQNDSSVRDILKRVEQQLHEVINDRNSSRNSWRSWWIWKFIDYKSLITFALCFALKYYLDQISHHRRDFTDLITISWHFFEEIEEKKDKKKKKNKFFAAIEGSVSMQEMFRDDAVLLAKVKLAVQTSYPGYPPFVVLVGRSKTWNQVFRYGVYTIVTFLLSALFSVLYLLENVVLCLGARILHFLRPDWTDWIDSFNGRCCLEVADGIVQYFFGNYFNTDPLYTPCELDHTKLFLRRVITVVSEQTKNSLWSFAACKRSCNTLPEHHNDPSKEKVLVFAICEKEMSKSEVLQLKIVLIFERDLLACLKKEYDKLEINYAPWKERVNNLRKLAKIYKEHSVPNSPPVVQLQPTSSSSAPALAPVEFISGSNFEFWTEIELPGFPTSSHPVEMRSNSSSVRGAKPLSLTPVTATSGTSSPPALWTSPRPGLTKINYKI
jgi:hypothetical protein